MHIPQYRRQIILIVLLVVAIALIILMITYNVFMERNATVNTELILEDIPEDNHNYEFIDERRYHILYEPDDAQSLELKTNIEHMLNAMRVEYVVSDISNVKAIDTNDFIILATYDWVSYQEVIDDVFALVSKGTSLLIAEMPGEDVLFKGYMTQLGIFEISNFPHVIEKMLIKDELLVGLNEGESLKCEAVNSEIYDIHLTDDVRVYLTDDEGISIYHTVEYGKGTIGVYNGSRLKDRESDGLIPAMLGTLGDGIVYPIINASVMFMDDWPAPFLFIDPDIYLEYGLNYDDFLKYVWWPDILSLIERYDITFSSTMILEYNDRQEPPFDVPYSVSDSSMYVHYQQVLQHGGELCMHGYNHEPLWFSAYVSKDLESAYNPWSTKEIAVEAMTYAASEFQKAFPKYNIHCYVPPSNVIDETGIEVIKESLGIPVILSSVYRGYSVEQPSFDFMVEDGVIYFPRVTSGSKFRDCIKYDIAQAMTAYGVFSHFIHPDDVISEERSYGLSWEEMRKEYKKMFDFMEDSYPFSNYETISNCALKLDGWYNMDYSVSYDSDAIRVKTSNAPDEYSLMLRTDRVIVEGEGYTLVKSGKRSYVVVATEPNIVILYQDEEG